jgi:hypothetical protein
MSCLPAGWCDRGISFQKGLDLRTNRESWNQGSCQFLKRRVGATLRSVPNNSEALQRLLQAETRADSGGGVPVASLLVPGLTVLAHPDVGRVGERVLLVGLPAGREELLSRREPQFSAPGSGILRPLADPFLSRRPLRLTSGPEPGSIVLDGRAAVTAVTANGGPIEEERVFSAAEIERGVVLLLAHRVVLLLSPFDPVGQANLPQFGLVGESAPMLQLRREIQRVAPLDVAVLLRGETGTGKELVAQALHQASPRRSRPFFAANMGAVPATLAAAELFGAAWRSAGSIPCARTPTSPPSFNLTPIPNPTSTVCRANPGKTGGLPQFSSLSQILPWPSWDGA